MPRFIPTALKIRQAVPRPPCYRFLRIGRACPCSRGPHTTSMYPSEIAAAATTHRSSAHKHARTHRPKQNQEHFRGNFFASCHHSTAQTNDLLSDHRGWDSASSLRGRSVFTRAAAAAVATSRDAQDPLQQIADTEAAAAVVTADATLFRYLRIDSIVWRWTLASGWSFWR